MACCGQLQLMKGPSPAQEASSQPFRSRAAQRCAERGMYMIFMREQYLHHAASGNSGRAAALGTATQARLAASFRGYKQLSSHSMAGIQQEQHS